LQLLPHRIRSLISIASPSSPMEEEVVGLLLGPQRHMRCILQWVERRLSLFSVFVDCGYFIYQPYIAGTPVPAPLTDRITICLSSVTTPSPLSIAKSRSPSSSSSSSNPSSSSIFLANDSVENSSQFCSNDDDTNDMALEWMQSHFQALQDSKRNRVSERSATVGKAETKGSDTIDDWESMLTSSEEGSLVTSEDRVSFTWDSFLTDTPLLFPCEYVRDISSYTPLCTAEDFSLEILANQKELLSTIIRRILHPQDVTDVPSMIHTRFLGPGTLSRWRLDAFSSSLLDTATSAGCSFACRVSEALSCEVLHRLFGSRLCLREKEVTYTSRQSSIVDFVCEVADSSDCTGTFQSLNLYRLGVSVTRILEIANVTRMTEEDLYYLLLRKLATLVIAHAHVCQQDHWDGSVICSKFSFSPPYLSCSICVSYLGV
jgi:hypothetical protein